MIEVQKINIKHISKLLSMSKTERKHKRCDMNLYLRCLIKNGLEVKLY